MKLYGFKESKTARMTLAMFMALAVLFVFIFDFGKVSTGETVAKEPVKNETIIEKTEEAVSEEPAVVSEDVITAADDAGEVSTMLAAMDDKEDYEATLRQILNIYYENNDEEAISTITKNVDERGEAIVNRYANAKAERDAVNLDYEKETVLVVYSDSLYLNANIGTVIDSTNIGGANMATVDLGPEYSAIDASAELNEDSAIIMAQPNYIYTLAEDETLENVEGATTKTDVPTVEDAEAAEDTNSVEESASVVEEPFVREDNEEKNLSEDDVTEITEEVAPVIKAAEDKDPEFKGANDANSTKGNRNMQFGTTGINAFAAWNELTYGKDPVKVGVIDTGVRASHEDLKGIVVEVSDNGADKNSHGTHVCGIIAASANNNMGMAGVAGGYNEIDHKTRKVVSLYSYNAGSLHTNDIVMGINKLTDNGCRVINMSIGGPNVDAVMDLALKNAYNKGVVIVAAAGNDDTDRIFYPSDSPYTISVINADSKTVKYRSSNYGELKDIAAPGVSIYSTTNASDSAYGLKTGTSMAAPVVTACAAMALYENPNLSVRDVRNLLYTSSGAAFNNYMGFGYVNALNVVKGANINYRTAGPGNIQFNIYSKTLYTGDTYAVEYAVAPYNTACTSLSWTSSNTDVATVDADGMITAKAAGSCTITGSVAGRSRSLTLTVKDRYTEATLNNGVYTNTKSTTTASPLGRLYCVVDNTTQPITGGSAYMNGYCIKLAKDQEVVITCESATMPTALHIYDEKGGRIQSGFAYKGAAAKVEFTSAKDQTIFIECSAWPGKSGSTALTGSITTGIVNKKQDAAAKSATKNASTVKIVTKLAKTRITKGTGAKKKATIKWKATKGAGGYKIYRSTKSGKNYKLVKTVNAKTTSFTNKGLKKGNYYYIVKPYCNVKVKGKTKTIIGKNANQVKIRVK